MKNIFFYLCFLFWGMFCMAQSDTVQVSYQEIGKFKLSLKDCLISTTDTSIQYNGYKNRQVLILAKTTSDSVITIVEKKTNKKGVSKNHGYFLKFDKNLHWMIIGEYKNGKKKSWLEFNN